MKVTDEMVEAAVATYEKGQKTVGESYHGAMRRAIEAALDCAGNGLLGDMSAAERDARVEAKFKQLDLAALRALWDSEEGEADCDDIHAELNRRGDGDYCAV